MEDCVCNSNDGILFLKQTEKQRNGFFFSKKKKKNIFFYFQRDCNFLEATGLRLKRMINICTYLKIIRKFIFKAKTESKLDF